MKTKSKRIQISLAKTVKSWTLCSSMKQIVVMIQIEATKISSHLLKKTIIESNKIMCLLRKTTKTAWKV